MHTLWQVNWAKATAHLQGKLPLKHDSSSIYQSTNTGQAGYASQHTLCCTQVWGVACRCALWQVPDCGKCQHTSWHTPACIMAHMHAQRHKKACAGTKRHAHCGGLLQAASHKALIQKYLMGQSREGQASQLIQAPRQVSQAKATAAHKPTLAHRCACTHS